MVLIDDWELVAQRTCTLRYDTLYLRRFFSTFFLLLFIIETTVEAVSAFDIAGMKTFNKNLFFLLDDYDVEERARQPANALA